MDLLLPTCVSGTNCLTLLPLGTTLTSVLHPEGLWGGGGEGGEGPHPAPNRTSPHPLGPGTPCAPAGTSCAHMMLLHGSSSLWPGAKRRRLLPRVRLVSWQVWGAPGWPGAGSGSTGQAPFIVTPTPLPTLPLQFAASWPCTTGFPWLNSKLFNLQPVPPEQGLQRLEGLRVQRPAWPP